MLKKVFLQIALSLLALQCMSQNDDRSGGWFSALNSFRIKGNWGWQTDINIRSTDRWHHFNTLMMRNALSYRVHKNLTFLNGYTYTLSRVVMGDFSGYTAEHQVYQQAFIRHRIGPVYTLHRPMLEERFLSRNIVKDKEVVTDGRMFSTRFRYLFRNMLPFRQQQVFNKGWYAVTQQEIMLITSNQSAVNGKTYDQFRAFGGLGYRFNSRFDLEAGYLYRDLATKTERHYHDHLLQLTTFLRL